MMDAQKATDEDITKASFQAFACLAEAIGEALRQIQEYGEFKHFTPVNDESLKGTDKGITQTLETTLEVLYVCR